MTTTPPAPAATSLRARLHEIIFEADTPAGRLFDIILIWSILLSVAAVVLESVSSVRAEYGQVLYAAEWFFTVLFTVEYVLRLTCVRQPLRYATGFYGIVDLLAIVPTYISFVVPGSQSLLTIRALRLLRTFRVLKLSQYLSEAQIIAAALRASRRKISVFLFSVLVVVLVVGTVMYVLEGEANGFTSIPTAIYWAIVTMTTVGYGDISPATPLGKTLASLLMVVGYAIIAVPTGIVTVELSRTGTDTVSTQVCPVCAAEGHDPDARHCKYCGARL